MKTMDMTHMDYREELHNLYEKKLHMEQQAQDRLRAEKDAE